MFSLIRNSSEYNFLFSRFLHIVFAAKKLLDAQITNNTVESLPILSQNLSKTTVEHSPLDDFPADLFTCNYVVILFFFRPWYKRKFGKKINENKFEFCFEFKFKTKNIGKFTIRKCHALCNIICILNKIPLKLRRIHRFRRREGEWSRNISHIWCYLFLCIADCCMQ